MEVRARWLAAWLAWCLTSLAMGAFGGAGCNEGRTPGHEDLSVIPPDIAVPRLPDLGPVACDAEHGCIGGQRCHFGICLPDNGVCVIDDQCQNDSYCYCLTDGTDGGVSHDSDGGGTGAGNGTGNSGDGGYGDGGEFVDASMAPVDAGGGAPSGCYCVPWGSPPRGSYDTSCRRPSYELSQVVTPTLLCQYAVDSVESTPLVGDLDGDGRPEIVFETIDNMSGGLHAMHGDDCSTYFDVRFDFAGYNASQLAMGDLDGDGKPEIVGVDLSRRVAVFNNQLQFMASFQAPYEFGQQGVVELGGPAIVDVDGKAPPEIVMAGQVLRYVPPPTPKGTAKLEQVWLQSTTLPYWGILSIAADIDGDGLPEILTGRNIYRGTDGTDITPAALLGLDAGGIYTAVADFNMDGKPDVALVVPSSETMRQIAIYDFAKGSFLLGPYVGRGGWGGPPTAADFDGDGQLEFAVGGVNQLVLYSPECTGNNRPAKCDPNGLPGEEWSRTISDQSSGSSGVAAFDFNGDGASEVVFRDECWLRGIDGKTGKALFALPATSATGVEVPTIADVDGDGHAEIIVSSTSYPGCKPGDDAETGAKWMGLTAGVMVYSDPKKLWMPARPVWNEHSYHVTNVLDDLTIPLQETAGWTVWNGYRQNEQGISGKPDGVGDFTARVPLVSPDTGPMDCASAWTLYADLCNRGAGSAQAGVSGAFYLSDPRLSATKPLCTTATTEVLQPGQCQTVSCDWTLPSETSGDIWFRADDDGKGDSREECHSGNDVLLEKAARCNLNG